VEGSISTQKKCRRHYGHTLSMEYDPAKHFNFDENRRHLWTDKWAKEQYLSGFMLWEIGKVCAQRNRSSAAWLHLNSLAPQEQVD
jgi:hypothetical protein